MTEFKNSGEFATTWVGGLGLIQGEEIVRCRDCKYYTYADKEHGNNDWCEIHDHIAWSVNGFCAWGKLRGEGEGE